LILIIMASYTRFLTGPTAYRSSANEAYLHRHGRVSRIHRKKPRGKPMPANVARSNAQKSAVRSRIEHVFVQQKARMGLFVRTIGLARATATITLVNMAYNMQRWCWLNSRQATA
jgi:IS5 family transposase